MAGVISMPMLATIFSAVGVLGAYVVAVQLLGLDSGAFWSQPQNKVDLYEDIYNGLIKSLVFGLIASWIAVFEGYDCIPTSEGLGQATTRTVVYSSLAILFMDFILTALMFSK
jgi:phospholipid/cholesterol/gamma-HCH transport system permease protein